MTRTLTLRLVALILLTVALVLLIGAAGAAAYLELQQYRTLKTTYPQILQILGAHEAALQKLTGGPTFTTGPAPAPAPESVPPPVPDKP